VVGYGPFSLCVIYKEALCPSSEEIYRLMITMIIIEEFDGPAPRAIAEAKHHFGRHVKLGQTLQLGRNNFEDEVDRRIQLGWAAFGKLRRVFSSSIPQILKTKVFNQCVLPVMIYGAELKSPT
jgi:hypothetical protein